MKNGPGRRLRYGMCGTGTTNSDLPVDTYMTYGTCMHNDNYVHTKVYS
jgi:hypothetical protein